MLSLAAMFSEVSGLSSLSLNLGVSGDVDTTSCFRMYRQLSADSGAPVSHVALQPDVAVIVHCRGEELGGGHAAEVCPSFLSL